MFCFCSRMEKFIRQIRYGLYGTRPMKSGTILKLPPPVWSAIYLAIAGAISAAFPWRTVIDLRFVWLGVALIVAGVGLGVYSMMRAKPAARPVLKTSAAALIQKPKPQIVSEPLVASPSPATSSAGARFDPRHGRAGTTRRCCQ